MQNLISKLTLIIFHPFLPTSSRVLSFNFHISPSQPVAAVNHTRPPGVGSMGKSMEFKGRPWFPHASHASLAFPCYANQSSDMEKAWKSMGSMGQDLLVI